MPTPRCFDAKPKESWGLKPFCPAWPTYALPAEPSSLLSDAALSPRVSRARGRVLEVASGTGRNLAFYDRNAVEELVLADEGIRRMFRRGPTGYRTDVSACR